MSDIKDVEKQIEIAMELLSRMRQLTSWGRREYTILILGVFIGVGMVAFALWLQWYLAVLQFLGLI